jgi:N-methylhydantoinase A
MRDRPIELVNIRVQAVGIIDKPVFEKHPLADHPPLQDASLYEREKLLPGSTLQQEALIVQLDSTTYLPEGWSATVDPYLNLHLQDMK